MQIAITAQHLSAKCAQDSCLIVGVYENQMLSAFAKVLDANHEHIISKVLSQCLLQGKLGQTLPLTLPNQSIALLVGCGSLQELTLPKFTKIARSAFRVLSTFNNIASANCYLAELPIANINTAIKCKILTETLYDGFYQYDQFKSKKTSPLALKNLIINVAKEEEEICNKYINAGQAVAAGVTLTKQLAQLPPNVCTTEYLAKAAYSLADAHPKISTTVLDTPMLQEIGAGAILAVGQGSINNPKLLIVEYQGAKDNTAPVALVGKGITFDSGGLSIKPADSMIGMKYDMCGAATVLGTLHAAAEFNLAINLVGVIPIAENLPSGSSYRPEDIITSLSGQTIEVLNTDAEGRLILADALTYSERFAPEIVIDIATLTGAVVIALGHEASAILSPNQKLADELLAASVISNDRLWQLPLWEEYQEHLESIFADMVNVGGRAAGTITAACFLQRFTKKFPAWAHLDIAGTAAMMTKTPERIPSGRPVPLLMQFLLNKVGAL